MVKFYFSFYRVQGYNSRKGLMLLFLLIGLSLVLIGIVGLQFTYLFYVDRIYRERRKYLQGLEHRSQLLQDELEAAKRQIAEQTELLVAADLRKKDEVWADLIDER